MSRQRKKKGRPISGWVILDKPKGIGSTQCVGKIKWLFKAAKAGHAGTLDPLASGMLPIALGEATKTVPFVMDGSKVYRFSVQWGAQTNTDDLEGEIIDTKSNRPSKQAVLEAIQNYRGVIEQIPPAFSAVKINGERAYDLARSGEAVKLASRKVEIFSFELLNHIDDEVSEFEIECSKGTYVRSLARDLGVDLGCLGHVCALRRENVLYFEPEDMVDLAALEALEGDLEQLDTHIAPTGMALEDIPEAIVSEQQARRIRSGNSVLLRGNDGLTDAQEACAVYGQDLVAIGSIDKGSFFPKKVFRHSAA